jgi:hypothetical protein
MDPYGEQPYVYFCAYDRMPGYADATFDGTYRSDCARLGVWPYAQIPPTPDGLPRSWHRPITFQIISAGRDGRFGPGTDLTSANPGYWTPRSPDAYVGQLGRFRDAADDVSNFHDFLLGVPSAP